MATATGLLKAYVAGDKFNLQREPMSKKGYLPFVTNYRASMLVTTAVCILAVDFPVFPRRFAKTETFGFSLMDAGVGSYVFAAGLVSQEARKGQQKVSPEGQAGSSSLSSSLSHVAKSLVECLPLLILGLCRLTAVKATGYHEHVTEYGVHWNFFFTLAACKVSQVLVINSKQTLTIVVHFQVISSLYFAFFPVYMSWPSSLILCLGHELFLSYRVRTGLCT